MAALIFRDIQDNIVVDQDRRACVESIRTLLSLLCGAEITALEDLQVKHEVCFAICEPFHYRLFSISRTEYQLYTYSQRKTMIESRITNALNDLNLWLAGCIRVAEHLNANKI